MYENILNATIKFNVQFNALSLLRATRAQKAEAAQKGRQR